MSWIAQHKSLGSGQAVAGLPRVRGDARAAPHLRRSGRTATRASSTSAGSVPREDARAAEGDGHRPQRTPSCPDAGGRAGVGQLSADETRLFARMAEVYAGFMEHTDAQIGRVIDFLERTGQLDNTLLFVFVGDNGCSGEGTPQRPRSTSMSVIVEGDRRNRSSGTWRASISSACPARTTTTRSGWAFAGNTPFRLCKQYTALGRRPEPVGRALARWDRGQGRAASPVPPRARTSCPTILEAIGIDAPSLRQHRAAGGHRGRLDALHVRRRRRSVDHTHPVLRDARQPWALPRRLEDRHVPRAQAVGERGRVEVRRGPLGALRPRRRTRPRPTTSWPAATPANLDDPMVKKLPRPRHPVVGRGGQATRCCPSTTASKPAPSTARSSTPSTPKTTCYEGAVRIQPFEAPPDPQPLLGRWKPTVEVPDGGATGPIAAMGGDSSGLDASTSRTGCPPTATTSPGRSSPTSGRPTPLPPGRHVDPLRVREDRP